MELKEAYLNNFLVHSEKYYKLCYIGWYCQEDPEYITTSYEDALNKWKEETGRQEYFHYEYKGGESAYLQIREITKEEYIKYILEQLGYFEKGVIREQAEKINNENTKNAHYQGYRKCYDKVSHLFSVLRDVMQHELSLHYDYDYDKVKKILDIVYQTEVES